MQDQAGVKEDVSFMLVKGKPQESTETVEETVVETSEEVSTDINK
jgi:hypothetical protein